MPLAVFPIAESIPEEWKPALTILVIVWAFYSFISERLPVDMTALSIMVLLILLGLVDEAEGISGFSNPATITVMAMFVLSAGIARTGALQVVMDILLRLGGRRVSQQILALGVIVGPISAFINNSAVVPTFLPIVESWAGKIGVSVSRLLIPLSYLSIIGGTVTVIGTSTNVLASGIAVQLGYKPFPLFLFTGVGLVAFGVGLLYLAFIAPYLLPDRQTLQTDGSFEQRYGLREYVSEVVISPESSLVGQTLRLSKLQRQFDVDVLEIIRNNIHFPQPLADKVLQVGDILLIRGAREELFQIKQEKGIYILPEQKFSRSELTQELVAEEDGVGEVLIMADSPLVGSTLKDIRFRQRYNATVLAIRRGEELVRQRLGTVRLKFGDILLLQGPRQSFLGLQTGRDLLLIEQRDVETLRTEKAAVAVLIGMGVVLMAALNWLPILVSALIGSILMVITGCLKPGELYSAIRWDIIFLLAGLIPLGIAMEKSNVTQWLADRFVMIGGNLSGYWLLVFFYLATMLLTELLSNNASVILMMPIAVKSAESLTLNPLSFMLAVTFAASCSFMTPIGYQTNTMVYTAGGYKFLDFTRVGAPLSALLAFLLPFVIVKLFEF